MRTDKAPNILFVLGDDHAGYVLGAVGTRQAATPNLDRLASEGTRSRTICNSRCALPRGSRCSPGSGPHRQFTRLPTPLAEDKPTLDEAIEQAGYSSGGGSKMHFNRPTRRGLDGIDDPMLNRRSRNVERRRRPATSRSR